MGNFINGLFKFQVLELGRLSFFLGIILISIVQSVFTNLFFEGDIYDTKPGLIPASWIIGIIFYLPMSILLAGRFNDIGINGYFVPVSQIIWAIALMSFPESKVLIFLFFLYIIFIFFWPSKEKPITPIGRPYSSEYENSGGAEKTEADAPSTPGNVRLPKIMPKDSFVSRQEGKVTFLLPGVLYRLNNKDKWLPIGITPIEIDRPDMVSSDMYGILSEDEQFYISSIKLRNHEPVLPLREVPGIPLTVIEEAKSTGLLEAKPVVLGTSFAKSTSAVEQLEKLSKLRSEGHISQHEFETLKSRIFSDNL